MKKLSNFFKKNQTNRHFKGAGQGVRLSSGQPTSSEESSGAPGATTASPSRPIDAKSAAAAAAEARLKKNAPLSREEQERKARLALAAKREAREAAIAELERQDEEKFNRSVTQSGPQLLEHSEHISTVLFTCELFGDDHTATKPVLAKEIEAFLREKLDDEDPDEKWLSAALMIHTLNKSEPKEAAIKLLNTYCTNILKNPTEEKYKKIRTSNKTFESTIAPVIGAREFMIAVGFTEIADDDNEFLVFTSDDGHLPSALEALHEATAVPIKVARCVEVFKIKEGQTVKHPKIPDDFFVRTTAELKAEQKEKEETTMKLMTLRTAEMRLRDEQANMKKYKYTLIRVRAPGNLLIQAVFGCHEPFSEVRTLIAELLAPSLVAAEFVFRDATNRAVDDESASLASHSLAPAALLHMTFVDAIDSEEESILDDKYSSLVKDFE